MKNIKMMNNKLIDLFLMFLIMFSFLFCKIPEKGNSQNTENRKPETVSDDFPSTESLIKDNDRYFIMEDWHPLVQSEEIQKIKQMVKEEDIIHEDDSLFDDNFSNEFSLIDEEGNMYCLFHDIRKLSSFKVQEYEIYKFWRKDFFWVFKETDEISVLWNYYNGSILILGTDNSRYITSRGIKVGDTADKVIQVYAKDCEVSEYNYEKKRFEVVSKHNAPFMALYKSDDCISINSGNAKSEEMRTISFLLQNNIVSKIVIKGVE
jgi:hypothetical protein